MVLTDERIEEICWTEVDQRLRSFARAIEKEVLQAREPVSKLVRTAPKSIFLNISDEDDFDCDFNGGDMSEVSWSNNQVVRCAVEYVRADLVSQPLAPPTKQEAQEPIAWMNPVTGCAVATCGYMGFDMPLYATPQPPAPEDFDTWIKNPYTIVLQKSIAEGYAPAPCPDCEQVIIEREAAYALADEYKAKVAALTSQTDPRDAYEQIEDFSKGNYRGT